MKLSDTDLSDPTEGFRPGSMAPQHTGFIKVPNTDENRRGPMPCLLLTPPLEFLCRSSSLDGWTRSR